MRIATLIVNPAAGRAGLLEACLPGFLAVLKAHGYEARVLTTSAAPGSARELALGALDSALVFACGGDGTVHGVVQALAGTNVPLGVLPLGTANALARNLGLPMDPVAALRALLAGSVRKIPLGRVVASGGERYFAVMAGCGPDGALVEAVSGRAKGRFGRAAYYATALRLFAVKQWPAFRVEYRLAGADAWCSVDAVGMLASRVPDLGGLFAGLTPEARMDHPLLQVQLLGSPAMVAFPAWFALWHRLNPWLTTVEVEEVRCSPLVGTVFAEADGEGLGVLPLGLSVVADGLRLMVPGGG